MTHASLSTAPQLPFSGIVALTFPARNASYPAPPSTLGNILVEAPNGDINANVAGILQIPLNDVNYPDAIATVLAGYELRDSMGNPVTAGDMADGTPVLVSADRNINANGSGIIASNANWKPAGTSSASFLPATTLTSTHSRTSTSPRLGRGMSTSVPPAARFTAPSLGSAVLTPAATALTPR